MFKVKVRTVGGISREEKPPEKGKVLVAMAAKGRRGREIPCLLRAAGK
jgi:hypothetical protein